MSLHTHASDEDIESYSLERLAEPKLSAIEEHLLTCAECQDRVRAEDAFAQAMRSALRDAARAPAAAAPRWSWFTRSRWPALAWAGSVASAGLLLVSHGTRAPEWQDVRLHAARGVADNGRARADRLVRLRIDTTELARAASWHIEVVSAGGRPVWTADVPVAEHTVTAEPGRLAAGQYWVRLAAGPQQDPVREFSLLVE